MSRHGARGAGLCRLRRVHEIPFASGHKWSEAT